MKQLAAELVVIGAGAAGLSTALRALQLGVSSVIVLEKRPYPGGNAAMAGGTLFGAETRLQKQQGNPTTVERAVQDILEHQNYDRVHIPLIRALVKKSAFMIDWIEELGGKYTAHPTQMTHTPVSPSKDFGHFRALTQRMAEEIKAGGGSLLTQTELHKICRKENGEFELSGVTKGTQFSLNAKALSISTGGFLGNEELMRHYFPQLETKERMSDAILHTGDGVGLASGLGAQLAKQCTINMHGMHSFDRCCRYPNKLGQEANLWVNRFGYRFVAENSSTASKNQLGNAVYNQPGQLCYALFDQTDRKRIMAGGYTTPQLRKVDLTHLPEILAAEHRQKKWVCISEDLEEIARWMGADAAVLKDTVSAYNHACAIGSDTMLGKEAQFLIPVAQPPYIALKCVPVTIDTYGPVKINERFQVLDVTGSPIRGLYAAGVVASGWQGVDYYPRGSSLGFSITGGLLAAESIHRFLTVG